MLRVRAKGVPGDTFHRCVINDSIRRHVVGPIWITEPTKPSTTMNVIPVPSLNIVSPLFP